MKPLHIYRGHLTTVKLVYLIICCCIYQIFSAKQIDVNFGLPKIFTVSRRKTFVSYPATIVFFQNDISMNFLVLLRTLVYSNSVFCIYQRSLACFSVLGRIAFCERLLS